VDCTPKPIITCAIIYVLWCRRSCCCCGCCCCCCCGCCRCCCCYCCRCDGWPAPIKKSWCAPPLPSSLPINAHLTRIPSCWGRTEIKSSPIQISIPSSDRNANVTLTHPIHDLFTLNSPRCHRPSEASKTERLLIDHPHPHSPRPPHPYFATPLRLSSFVPPFSLYPRQDYLFAISSSLCYRYAPLLISLSVDNTLQ